MKIVYFHLQGNRSIPDDFAEKESSIWVTPSNADWCEPEAWGEGIRQNIAEYEFADELGFDGLGVNEHHANGYGGFPAPGMTGFFLAMRKSKAAIVMMGETLPTHQPVRVAEELAIIDAVSGGRLIAGMPVGTPMDTAITGGVPPTEIRPRYYEALELVKQAWRRPGPFAFNGKYTQLRYVNPWPQPIQKPPPIWLAGGSSKETYEFAAQNEYMYSNLSLRGVSAAKAQLDQYWDCVEAAGLDDNPYRAGMILSVAVGDTDAEAEELYSYHKTRFFQFAGHVPANLSAVPGYLTKDSLRGVVNKLGRVDYYKPPVQPTWKSLVDSGTVIAGSVDTVAERIYDICKTLRVGHLVVNLQTSTMSTELARRNMELFATKVMPRLKTLWQDTEYENKWWPKAADRSLDHLEEVSR